MDLGSGVPVDLPSSDDSSSSSSSSSGSSSSSSSKSSLKSLSSLESRTNASIEKMAKQSDESNELSGTNLPAIGDEHVIDGIHEDEPTIESNQPLGTNAPGIEEFTEKKDDDSRNVDDYDIEVIEGAEATALKLDPYPEAGENVDVDEGYHCNEPPIVEKCRDLIYSKWPALNGTFGKLLLVCGVGTVLLYDSVY